MKKILIVDDEESIRTLLSYNLAQSNFETITAEDGEEAIQKIVAEQPDLVLLDLMLPKIDGIDVCKQLRHDNNRVPIIMLTARGEEPDKILGLEIGADDYMTKPFSPREVIARVKAVLRRTHDADSSMNRTSVNATLTEGDLIVYPERYEATLKGETLSLTPKEFELLVYFMRHKNRVLTRDQLLQAVWDYSFVGDTRIVDVHVSHLREKIEENTRKPRYIKTIRGIGYKFEEQRL